MQTADLDTVHTRHKAGNQAVSGFARRSGNFEQACEIAGRWGAENAISYHSLIRTSAQALDDLSPTERLVLMLYLSILTQEKLNRGETTLFLSNESIAILSGLDIRSIQRINEALEKKLYLIRRYNRSNRRCRQAGIDLSPFLQRYLEGVFDAQREAKWQAVLDRRKELEELALSTPELPAAKPVTPDTVEPDPARSQQQAGEYQVAPTTGSDSATMRVKEITSSSHGAETGTSPSSTTDMSSLDDTHVTQTNPQTYFQEKCIAGRSRLMKKEGAGLVPRTAPSGCIARTKAENANGDGKSGLRHRQQNQEFADLRAISSKLDSSLEKHVHPLAAAADLLAEIDPDAGDRLLAVFQRIYRNDQRRALELLVILAESARLGEEGVKHPLRWLRYFERPESRSFDCRRSLGKLMEMRKAENLSSRGSGLEPEQLPSLAALARGEEEWSRILERLEAELTPAVVSAWFADAKLERDDGNKRRIVLPSIFARDWVRQNFDLHLARILGSRNFDLVARENGRAKRA